MPPPPHFQILEKFAFQPCFWPKFQLVRGKISEFSLPRPLSFQGKPAPKTLLLETCAAHTHQKKLSAPPPRGLVKENGKFGIIFLKIHGDNIRTQRSNTFLLGLFVLI